MTVLCVYLNTMFMILITLMRTIKNKKLKELSGVTFDQAPDGQPALTKVESEALARGIIRVNERRQSRKRMLFKLLETQTASNNN